MTWMIQKVYEEGKLTAYECVDEAGAVFTKKFPTQWTEGQRQKKLKESLGATDLTGKPEAVDEEGQIVKTEIINHDLKGKTFDKTKGVFK